MILDNFSLETLSISIVSVVGAVGLCMRGSKCKRISCCCMDIEREVNIERDIEMDELNK